MKKLTALALALILLVSCAATAMAATEYNLSLLRNHYKTAEYMMQENDSRVAYGSAVLLDYIMAKGTLDGAFVATSGVSYMANFAGCLDCYFLCQDGTYLNLFLVPSTEGKIGHLSDYGYKTSKPSSAGFTYLEVSNGELVEGVQYLINEMQGDK